MVVKGEKVTYVLLCFGVIRFTPEASKRQRDQGIHTRQIPEHMSTWKTLKVKSGLLSEQKCLFKLLAQMKWCCLPLQLLQFYSM